MIGAQQDNIGIVTCHDGPSLASGEIIAPPVGLNKDDPNFHNNYQDTEAFLRAGGRRGRQYAPLTDGTYFINRWFATVELIDKKIVPIGFVGVVVSYYGLVGHDLSGTDFRHGERVQEGERGVWAKPLGPGKYPFNTYAGSVVLVPTTNFVLHWITGKSEGHRYDESLRSIDLVTKDAYEPTLPLSVVVHIDYEKAPSVIQRFGDVKQLITQTLDPMLSAYFRDVAHRRSMLELIHERDLIQKEAREELKRKFLAFDIECVDVLIGKPETASADGKIETLLDQLRQRQLATEQIETFARQQQAAAKRQELNDAQAKADMQVELSQSKVQIDVITNQAEANLSKSRKEAEQTIILAEADSRRRSLEGQGESERVRQDRPIRGAGTAQEGRLVRRPATLRDVTGLGVPFQEPAADRPPSGLHLKRRSRGRRPRYAAENCDGREDRPARPGTGGKSRQRERTDRVNSAAARSLRREEQKRQEVPQLVRRFDETGGHWRGVLNRALLDVRRGECPPCRVGQKQVYLLGGLAEHQP